MDIAFVKNRVRKLATGPANSAYRTVVARNLPPLTVAGLVKQVNCPGLPYRHEYNYHLAQTFYDEGKKSQARADCIKRALAAYSPDALADLYEELSAAEMSLFAKSHGIERFSPIDADRQMKLAANDIQGTPNRADYLFEGGDFTARKRAQQRRSQEQQRAQMQGPMSGLQSIQQRLQQRHDGAGSRVAALQAEGIRNTRRNLEAQRAQAARLSGKLASASAVRREPPPVPLPIPRGPARCRRRTWWPGR